MPIFDAYITVDWSAASRKTRAGKDSIWYCLVVRENGRAVIRDVQNPRTRQDAYDQVFAHLAEFHRQGLVTLVGFDFPYSFPRGFAETLGLKGQSPWLLIWDELRRIIQDAPDNSNNRFHAASRLNERITRGPGPFWCCPRNFETSLLRRGKDLYVLPDGIAEYRIAEVRARRFTTPGPHSVWQLYTQGSVGSQALLGIPRVRALRFASELESVSRVWPFETGLSSLKRPGRGEWSIMHAEIYPSLYKISRIFGLCLDEMQVRTLALHFEELDSRDELAHLFGGECDLTVEEQQAVISEEGWILGVALKMT
jgi:hypothetical protein